MRRKRILPHWKLMSLMLRSPGPNRLVEVVSQTNASSNRLRILCSRCAKKAIDESQSRLDKSYFIRQGKPYNGGNHRRFKRAMSGVTGYNRLRYGQTVGPFEKLNCEKCGQRNEP